MDQSGPNWTYVNQMDRSELRVLELGIVNPPPPPNGKFIAPKP